MMPRSTTTLVLTRNRQALPVVVGKSVLNLALRSLIHVFLKATTRRVSFIDRDLQNFSITDNRLDSGSERFLTD